MKSTTKLKVFASAMYVITSIGGVIAFASFILMTISKFFQVGLAKDYTWTEVFLPIYIYLAWIILTIVFVKLFGKRAVKSIAKELDEERPDKSKWQQRLDEMQAAKQKRN